MKTVRLRVRGRVQGVGYRAWAIETAGTLQLRGWVRNRADDSVEMLVTGADDAVEAMVEACRRGPPGARVTEVETAAAEDDGSPAFVARSTE
ncbi:MAG TPA: acylphosphatase [Stellaceae bacterium]